MTSRVLLWPVSPSSARTVDTVEGKVRDVKGDGLILELAYKMVKGDLDQADRDTYINDSNSRVTKVSLQG